MAELADAADSKSFFEDLHHNAWFCIALVKPRQSGRGLCCRTHWDAPHRTKSQTELTPELTPVKGVGEGRNHPGVFLIRERVWIARGEKIEETGGRRLAREW